jgi:hypothetical protein
MRNSNLKLMLDRLVAKMEAEDAELGTYTFTLKDGTECALALSMSSHATMGLEITMQVANDEGVRTVAGEDESSFVN